MQVVLEAPGPRTTPHRGDRSARVRPVPALPRFVSDPSQRPGSPPGVRGVDARL